MLEDAPIRRDYAAEPSLLGRVTDLLGIVFPFLPDQLHHASRLGLRWDDVSTPFVVTEGTDLPVLAHVGVLELPLVVEGEAVLAAGIHAVATHPDHRRQGHYRRVMDSVLPYVRERHPLAILSTDRPELYEPFGFREVAEHRFVGPAPTATSSLASRPLRFDDPADVGLLRGLLRERQPVSARFGLAGEEAVFLFNQAKEPPRFVPDLDALLVYEVAEGVLRLYDVVARRMPDLAEIVAAVPEPVRRVETYFEPRALEGDLEPEPHVLDGDDRMCVRGELACEGRPFLWPRPNRC